MYKTHEQVVVVIVEQIVIVLVEVTQDVSHAILNVTCRHIAYLKGG